MRMAHIAGMKITILGRAQPSQTLPRAGYVHVRPHARGAQRQNENMCSWKDVGARRRRAPTTPKPSRGRAMFTSASATPRAFVYSFPIRWPISPRRPRKPILEQVKPVEGLRPPKPSRWRVVSWERTALPSLHACARGYAGFDTPINPRYHTL